MATRGPPIDYSKIEPWKPNPVQEDFIKSNCEDRIFGGARAGGKTAAIVADFGVKALQNKEFGGHYFTGLILRAEENQLVDVKTEMKKQYVDRGLARLLGGSERKLILEPSIYGHAELYFSYLEKAEDAERHRGRNLQWICYEEIGDVEDPALVRDLKACLRSEGDLPSFFLATCNPNSAGDSWINQQYVLPSPPFKEFAHYDPDGNFLGLRVFMPARIDDNLALSPLERKRYMRRIRESCIGKPNRLRAWLDGTFGLPQGGSMFDNWDPDIHRVPEFEIPESWRIYRSFDWGWSEPACMLWLAESDGSPWVDTSTGYRVKRDVPRGTKFVIGELYFHDPEKTNKGLEMTDPEIIEAVLQYEEDHPQLGRAKENMGVSDWQIWNVPRTSTTGMTLYEEFYEPAELYFEKADKSYERSGGGQKVKFRHAAWQRIRNLLENSAANIVERPGLYVFDSCPLLCSFIPVAIRDPKNPDDIKNREDHFYAALIYGIDFGEPSPVEEGDFGIFGFRQGGGDFIDHMPYSPHGGM